MLESAYTPVIGRHGLVSNGFLLWKIGAQHVENASEKLVEFHPHIPQRGRTIYPRSVLVPTVSEFYPKDTPQLTADLSTRKIPKLTGTRRRFYPVSTEPITTITTYI